jgi:hypothetical protein
MDPSAPPEELPPEELPLEEPPDEPSPEFEGDVEHAAR